ncbi:hypothetical protein [Barrientosiimonas endolithica]|uniref:Uncharacterized protein n=1 Tax=Barrientosiimonas endolithica TaxID=1535208 RepID=A0ABM8H8V6_9MICO|nr:hypothetical protein [Barrientosiimonas endolithica]BDZ57300.1 hypothetical protein GCM10025872_09570 [Barrientosiimonas endolithica]
MLVTVDRHVPHLHRLQQHLDGRLQQGLQVGVGADEVLGGDHEGAAGDPDLDDVEAQGDVVGGVELGEEVARQLVGDLPLAEDAHQRHVAVHGLHEQLLALHLEAHVAVGVDVGAIAVVLQRIQHATAQRRLVGRGREVRQ